MTHAKESISIEIGKGIYFFHPPVELLMNLFGIVEKPIIQKEYKICKMIQGEWSEEGNEHNYE